MEDRESDDQQENYLLDFPSFEAYSKALLSQVVTATKSSNGLPDEGDDFDYYLSFPGFQTFCSKMSTRIDKIINQIIRHQQLPCYWSVDSNVGGASSSAKAEEKFEVLVEANDILLERVNVMLDEVSGLRKNLDQPVGGASVQQGTVEVSSRGSKRDSVRKQMGVYKFIHSRNVTRPQVRFKDQADNSNHPFIPRIRHKPNARVPLPEVYQRLEESTSLSALIANTKEWVESEAWSSHPYQFELNNLEPFPEQLELKEPQLPASHEDTPFTYIDSLEGLQKLRDDLREVTEFAIDLEHHSYRSFQGFTCLMQISTRSHDYIVDTLEVRHHLPLLLEPFTDPNILKVMHGAYYDVEWLQKDFGLYVVNLFDTGQASKALQLPKLSLAFLLHYCCQVQADKQFQLADWRIRPLPPEMLKYARDDTHYLLYIYDRMRNELIRRGDKSNHLLHLVLTKSRDLCLRQYKKPFFSENSYLELYYKHKRMFNSHQLLCLKLLYAWRDHVGRDEDESPSYVLPNHMMFQIAEILPREMGGVLACCNPIPILLRQQQHEVFMLVQQARDSPLTDKLPTIAEKTPSLAKVSEVDMEVDGRAVSLPSATSRIAITGPAVRVVKPAVSVLEEVVGKTRLDGRVVGVKQVLSKFLLQYEEAHVMTPSEVLVQQQLAYEALAASSRLKEKHPYSPSVAEPQPVVAQEGGASHMTLSVREMGHEDSPPAGSDRPMKKPRYSTEVNSDFSPFNYQHSNFTDYTQQGQSGRESYDPHSTPKGRGNHKRDPNFPAPPRSRVQHRAGQKSHTFRRKT